MYFRCYCIHYVAADVLNDNGMIFLGLLVLIGFNVVYALIAAILVAIEVLYSTCIYTCVTVSSC